MKSKKELRHYANIQTALPLLIFAVTAVIFCTLFIGLHYRKYPIIALFSSSNLHLYLFSFSLGAVVFVIFRLIFMRISIPGIESFRQKQFTYKQTIYITSFICSIMFFLLITRRFIAEFHEYPARDIPYKSFHLIPESVVVFLIFFVCFLLILFFQAYDNKNPIKILTVIAYGFTIFYVYYSLSTHTIDKNSSFDVYHGSAYIQSIYNALYYIPYDLETTGVYGHYGIIYAVIMRIFRLKSESVFTLIALAGVVTIICCIYIIQSLIRSDSLRIITVVSLAVPQAMVYMKNYWMTYPHKTLFPMLLIAWLTFSFKHYRTKKYGWQSPLFLLTAYLISILGIVWNTETGLYCLVCVVASHIFYIWQKHSWISLYALGNYFLHLLSCVLSVSGAFGIVWLYNLYCGHRKGFSVTFQLKDFFFPLGIIDSFLGSGDHADVIFGNHAWIYVLILFILSALYALNHTTVLAFPESRPNRKIPVVASLSFLGIMHFALYFSHAAYGKLSMCHLPAVILIAYLCDQFGGNELFSFQDRVMNIRGICKKSFTIMGFLTLTVLSAEVLTVGSITLGLNGYKDQGKSSIPHLAALYNSVIPPDTFSIGSCVDVLNYQLHQESDAHYRDLSNLNLGGIDISEKIVNDALEKERFAVWLMGNGESNILSKILAGNPAFQLTHEIDLGGYPLRLYSRNDNLP